MSARAGPSSARNALDAQDGLFFAVGCGRSGTTILMDVLAHHESVAALNDRQELWVRSFPVADVWGRRDSIDPRSRLALGLEHAREPGRSEDGRPVGVRAFLRRVEARRVGPDARRREVVVEKLPTNAFRLPFLRAVAPRAGYVLVLRHGVEVARSIARRIDEGTWDGIGGRRGGFLALHAREHGYEDLLARCRTPFDLGLLEWRMSVDASLDFFESPGAPEPLVLRYESMLADPGLLCDRLEAFLGIGASAAMRAFARESLRQRSEPGGEGPGPGVPESAEAIAGERLRALAYWKERAA